MSPSLFSKKPPKPAQYITIVSGLPRSGTSMMIQMLKVGGIEPVTDNLRLADESNPKGYYEFERVKKLKEGDTEWVKSAAGKSVKVISALLDGLPAGYQYRVVFMQRNMDEILASQKQMLISRGEPVDKVSDEQLAEIFQKHLQKTAAWLASQPNVQVLYINYNDMLKDPSPSLKRVNQFLDGKLNLEEMAGVIDKNLYRQRKP
jgi:hypothetical protein